MTGPSDPLDPAVNSAIDADPWEDDGEPWDEMGDFPLEIEDDDDDL